MNTSQSVFVVCVTHRPLNDNCVFCVCLPDSTPCIVVANNAAEEYIALFDVEVYPEK
jgi:hypothetical protein